MVAVAERMVEVVAAVEGTAVMAVTAVMAAAEAAVEAQSHEFRSVWPQCMIG